MIKFLWKRRISLKRKAFNGLFEMSMKLKETNGDPFLIRSILGKFDPKPKYKRTNRRRTRILKADDSDE